MKNLFYAILLILWVLFLCGCANIGPNLTNTGPLPSYTETITPTIPYSTPIEPAYPDSRPPVLTSEQIPPSPKPR